MPELPEVETVARQLAPLVEGRRLLRLEPHDARLALSLDTLARMEGRRVDAVRRIGKQVGLRLESAGGLPACWILVHLRMTGRLVYFPPGPAPGHAPPSRARFHLDRGRVEFFDARRFGTITLACDPPPEPGLDPVGPRFTTRRLAELAAGSRTPIKVWLLRQDRLAGIGNIYASEACHGAGIDPRRPAGSLTAEELSRLRRALRKTLARAIDSGGTSFRDFLNVQGELGRYARSLTVYGREGDPCRRCRTPIERIVQQQRATFFCPHCQS